MGLTAGKKETIGEQVLAQMREQILTGVWKEGEKIPSENRLCEMFSVSRVTVRQAIQRLSALGLLETKPGGGSCVRSRNLDSFMRGAVPASSLKDEDLLDFLYFRIYFEAMAAFWAATVISEEQIDALERTIQNMVESRTERERFAACDLEFHMLLARSTGNQAVIFLEKQMQEVMSEQMSEVMGEHGIEYGIDGHRKIIEALRRRDARGAHQKMFVHVDRGMRRYEEYILERRMKSEEGC